MRRYHLRPFRQFPAAPPSAPALPKTRQITRWLLTRPEHLPALAGHVRSFDEMMTARRGDQQLEPWLATVEAEDQADQPELRSFAVGIRHDQDAVAAD